MAFGFRATSRPLEQIWCRPHWRKRPRFDPLCALVCDVGHRQNAGSVKLRRPRDGLCNHAGKPDDYDVVGGDGKIIGRERKPGGGADHWFWALKAVVRPTLRGSGTTPTREEAAAAFRVAWDRSHAHKQ